MVIRLWVYYLYSCLPNCRKAVGLSGGKAEEAGNDLSSNLVLMVVALAKTLVIQFCFNNLLSSCFILLNLLLPGLAFD